ncbi:transcriptional regulator [Qipengyuania marisflavi]|uniref:Transcriptional regulator n=1 Tax=Qipengyuania marisflavi TaxID=2486356 RepID=A0A5S3P6S9_9SPHN|nr:transcriptional regulator [Qipengyuania marisflavi]TMM48923.1 transcriptional regulator [Qipengyuania marisflavi]
MTAHDPAFSRQTAAAVFPKEARRVFADRYPEIPHLLRHRLDRDDRLTLPALAELAEQLPATAIEYNRGQQPIGVDGKPAPTGLSIGETIRHIASSDSWAVLKNIEQVPAYRVLLMKLLEELRPVIEARTGEMLTPQGFVFISSPMAVTPYHFDPEHNILLQLSGSKTMTQFPAGDPRFAPDSVHESYHLGGPRELAWSDRMAPRGTEFRLGRRDALYVPVMAPHFVRNGPVSSISLSITWRSDWSYAEAGARCFNGLVRRIGVTPRPPGRWPASNSAKSLAFRAWRRVFGSPGQT